MSKKVLCTILAACMMTAAFTSCGESNAKNSSATSASQGETSVSNEETSGSNEENSSSAPAVNMDEEPYLVHFQYCVSAEGKNQQAITDAISAAARDAINMEVNLIPQTIGTWASSMSMMLAANEPLDLFVCGSGNFSSYIEAGYMRNWAEYFDYLPDVIETMGDDMKAGYVGDFYVGFSQMKERGYQSGLVCRADIMDALGLTPEDFSVTTQDYSTYDQITNLFAAVKEAHPEMTINGGTQPLFTQLTFFGDGLGDNFGVLENYGQSKKIVNWFETEQASIFAHLARDWFEKGYFSADAATGTDSGETLMRAGNLFSYFTAIKPNTNVEKKAQTGYDVYVIPTAETVFTSSGSVNGMVYSLANASEDPVKASIFYNWAFASQEFSDILNWGIEGTDWVLTDDGMAAYPEGLDASSVSYHQDFGWAYPNQFAGHPWIGNEPDIWDQYVEYNSNMLRSSAFGFTFNSTEVADQMAACASVYDQYDNDLGFGTLDPDESLAALNNALYSNGLQDIMDAKQSQLDAWFADQN